MNGSVSWAPAGLTTFQLSFTLCLAFAKGYSQSLQAQERLQTSNLPLYQHPEDAKWTRKEPQALLMCLGGPFSYKFFSNWNILPLSRAPAVPPGRLASAFECRPLPEA